MARLFKKEKPEEDFDEEFEDVAPKKKLPPLPSKEEAGEESNENIRVVEREINLEYINQKINHLISTTEEILKKINSATE